MSFEHIAIAFLAVLFVIQQFFWSKIVFGLTERLTARPDMRVSVERTPVDENALSIDPRDAEAADTLNRAFKIG